MNSNKCMEHQVTKIYLDWALDDRLCNP